MLISSSTVYTSLSSVLPTVRRRKGYRVKRHLLNSGNFAQHIKPIQNKEKSQGTPSVSWLCFYGRSGGTRLCFANPASSATVALQQYPPQTSLLKTVHRTVFLTQLTLLGFKSRTYQKQKRTELKVLSVSVVGVAGFERLKTLRETQ